MWREIKKVIHHNQSFVLTTHRNPDGDGIGSACALGELLIMMGKEARFICDSPLPSKFKFLDFHNLYEEYDPLQNYNGSEVLIIVDAHQKERIGRVASLASDPKVPVIRIDHHEPCGKASSLTAIDSHASSTGSMIYTLFKECGYELNLPAARGLYASILCDTGRFCYASTDRKAHKIAEECIKLGVDPDEMYDRLFREISLPEFNIIAKFLKNMEVHCGERVIVQQIRWQDYKDLGEEARKALQGDLEFFQEFNKMVRGIDCIVILRELEGGEVRVSLRSNTNLAVNKITSSLGGGGHKKAAGATLKGQLKEVKEKVIARLNEFLPKIPEKKV